MMYTPKTNMKPENRPQTFMFRFCVQFGGSIFCFLNMVIFQAAMLVYHKVRAYYGVLKEELDDFMSIEFFIAWGS